MMKKRDFVSIERKEWDLEPDVEALEHASTLDFAEAEKAFKILSDKGSVLSMANLGHRYEFRPRDYGGPDYSKAEFWYKKAIASGSAAATLPCGYFYLRRKNYEGARATFSIGVERKYAPAFVRLADLYIEGLGVAKDYTKARDLLRDASQLGNIWAKRALARMDMNIGRNPAIQIRGLIMCLIADLQFYLKKKRSPHSERLKK